MRERKSMHIITPPTIKKNNNKNNHEALKGIIDKCARVLFFSVLFLSRRIDRATQRWKKKKKNFLTR